MATFASANRASALGLNVRCYQQALVPRQRHDGPGRRAAGTLAPPVSAPSTSSSCRQVACNAKGGGGGEGGVPALSLDALAPLTRTALYRTWLQGAVVLVILGAIDAGFSGDWSRTGVLTTGQEAQLRGLLTLLGFFHIGCAVVAANAAKAKGLSWAPATAKVLAVGFLALLEVLLAEPGEAKQP